MGRTGWWKATRLRDSSTTRSLGDADFCRFFGANHVIRSNYWHGTLGSEIGPAHVDGFQSYDVNGEIAQHIRIEGNRMADFYHQGFLAEAGYYSNSFDIIICNNLFRAAKNWGVIVYDGIRDVKVYNNLFLDIAGCAVGINSGATGEVKNNIFYNSTGWDSSTPASYGPRTSGSRLVARWAAGSTATCSMWIPCLSVLLAPISICAPAARPSTPASA